MMKPSAILKSGILIVVLIVYIVHFLSRLSALKLCCWGFDKDSDSLAYIDCLEAEEQRERAAAIAVFTLRMSRAIEVLNRAKPSTNRIT